MSIDHRFLSITCCFRKREKDDESLSTISSSRPSMRSTGFRKSIGLTQECIKCELMRNPTRLIKTKENY